MGFNFPNTPAINDSFTPLGGPTYVWDGSVWKMTGTSGIGVTAQEYNRVVNGAFQVSQENGDTASASTGYYMADQWASSHSTTGAVGYGRQTGFVSPNGSKYRIGTNVNTADTSIAAGEWWGVNQPIEGFRVADFQWGTAQAKQVILRFVARGTIAGTFSGAIRNAASNRSYAFTFTINAANTDETKIIVIPGDTTGTWPTDNTKAMELFFTFACGTNLSGITNSWTAGGGIGVAGLTNGLATVANTFYIADVGLYLDPQNTGVPPPWVTPDFASELLACQRYWEKINCDINCYSVSGVAMTWRLYWKANKRTGPPCTSAPVQSGGCAFVQLDTVTLESVRIWVNCNATGAMYYSAVITANARM